MNRKEEIIRLWFDMWLRQTNLGIDDIFAENVTYIESWGPEYSGRARVKHWFDEWNTRGRVLIWDIKQFFHKEDQTVVEWYFKNQMNDGRIEEFDGMSLIKWAPDDKIKYLAEFGCNVDRYDPYRNGGTPQFREDQSKWF